MGNSASKPKLESDLPKSKMLINEKEEVASEGNVVTNTEQPELNPEELKPDTEQSESNTEQLSPDQDNNISEGKQIDSWRIDVIETFNPFDNNMAVLRSGCWNVEEGFIGDMFETNLGEFGTEQDESDYKDDKLYIIDLNETQITLKKNKDKIILLKNKACIDPITRNILIDDKIDHHFATNIVPEKFKKDFSTYYYSKYFSFFGGANNPYNFIKNPNTNKYVSIKSALGKRIMKKYIISLMS